MRLGDLLLKEAWNPEVAALGNSTLPTVCDKLNLYPNYDFATYTKYARIDPI